MTVAQARAKRHRPAVAGVVAGATAVVVAGALSISSSRYFAFAFVLGVAGVLAIVITIGKPLRRGGSPQGNSTAMIAIGSALFVVAGAAQTFPPHSVLLAVLVLLVGIGLFTVGVAILGGGFFGFLGAAASGFIAPALMLAPTPIALDHVGTTVSCTVDRYRGHAVYDFTASCPNGESYAFTSKRSRDFPGGKVKVIVDPNNVLEAQFVGEHNPSADLVGGILSILVGAGIVAAAALNRRRHRGQVRPVVKPMIHT
ncbi:MAG TPA: hypothetical protein VGD34_28610 [Kribbella sp.]